MEVLQYIDTCWISSNIYFNNNYSKCTHNKTHAYVPCILRKAGQKNTVVSINPTNPWPKSPTQKIFWHFQGKTSHKYLDLYSKFFSGKWIFFHTDQSKKILESYMKQRYTFFLPNKNIHLTCLYCSRKFVDTFSRENGVNPLINDHFSMQHHCKKLRMLPIFSWSHVP